MDDESNKNSILHRISSTSPARYAAQERDLPRFIFSSYCCSNTQHVALFIAAQEERWSMMVEKLTCSYPPVLEQQGLGPCAGGRFLSYQTT